MANLPHVIILGCGRSGTSIFGELFDHLPEYQYYSEPPFEEIINREITGPVALKVPRESEGFPPDKGLSFPLAILTDKLSSLQCYWQVRHPLDTVCSLKVGISRNWGHHPQPPDWREWLEQPLAMQCAHHWNYINTVGFASARHLSTVTYFEEMIADPLAFANTVGQKIGFDAKNSPQSLQPWADRVQNKNNEQFVEAETSRAYSTEDHSVKVGRWRENLSQAELQMVLPMVQETAQRLGYDLSEAANL